MHPDFDCDRLDMVGTIRRLSNQPNWSHHKIHSEATGIVENKSALIFCFGAATLSVGSLGRVSCWSPLGVPPGVLHTPNIYFNSIRLHIRVWVLLRLFYHRTISSSSACETLSRNQHNLVAFFPFLMVFLIALLGISLLCRGHSCVMGDNQQSSGVVIARSRSLGALDYQCRDLHPINYHSTNSISINRPNHQTDHTHKPAPTLPAPRQKP
jgi:hypothetical protein